MGEKFSIINYKLKETTTQRARAHIPGGALAPPGMPFALFSVFFLRYYSF